MSFVHGDRRAPAVTPLPLAAGASGVPVAQAPVLDLTQPAPTRPLPANVNLFGPPDAASAAAMGLDSGRVLPAAPPSELSGSNVPLDIDVRGGSSPEAAFAVEPDRPVSGRRYDSTRVDFELEIGAITCYYPIVLVTETLLVLAVKDVPPGYPLFTPMQKVGLPVVVHSADKAVRYKTVSFGGSFDWLDGTKVLVLAIQERQEVDA